MCPTLDGASAALNKQLQVSHRQISRDLWRQLAALRGSHAGVSMLRLGFAHFSDSEIRFGAMNGQMQPRGGGCREFLGVTGESAALGPEIILLGSLRHIVNFVQCRINSTSALSSLLASLQVLKVERERANILNLFMRLLRRIIQTPGVESLSASMMERWNEIPDL